MKNRQRYLYEQCTNILHVAASLARRRSLAPRLGNDGRKWFCNNLSYALRCQLKTCQRAEKKVK
jgi:hypothetical protein